MDSNAIWVVKVGGAILDKAGALREFLGCLKQIKASTSVSIVLVHGGGSSVDEMLSGAGFASHKIDGLRVSPKEQIPIISGVLSGSVNKKLVAESNSLGMAAVGLSLMDGQSVVCNAADQKLGAVGIPAPGDDSLLKALIKCSFLPVVSSIGSLEDGQIVNVNADDAAVAISKLLGAQLVLLTDVSGVKDGHGNVMHTLSGAQAESLIQQGVINGGMVAKVNAAISAAQHLRRSIAVASWDQPEQLHLMMSGQSTGTRILPN